MAVYSTLMSNERILERVRNFHTASILLVVCGGCANESLAYAKRIPVFISKEGESLDKSILCGHVIPYAAKKTAEQIMQMLHNEGYNVNCCTIPIGPESLCIQREDSNCIFSNIAKADLILALCCPAGVVGIKRQVKNIPVVPLMIPQGQLFYVFKDTLHSREILHEESFILK